jgi:hypothetical protein
MLFGKGCFLRKGFLREPYLGFFYKICAGPFGGAADKILGVPPASLPKTKRKLSLSNQQQ